MKINKKTNNFDLLRLLLAIIVAIYHLGVLTEIDTIMNISKYFSSQLAVDAFFIVSGFLIFMSYESSDTVKKYFQKRIRRIFPGYIFVIIICAFSLYFLSEKTLEHYFFSKEFLGYLVANLLTLNFLQPTLPGVFEHNIMPAVNGALWTIKVEIIFYICVPFIVYFVKKYYAIYTLMAVYLFSIIYSVMMTNLATEYDSEFFLTLEKQLPGQLAFFISGALVYYYFDIFHKHSKIFLTVGIAILVAHTFYVNLYIFYPISLSFLVLYFATALRYLGNFGKFGDLSFGIYIWHFPVIQVFVSLGLFSNLPLGILSLIFSIFFTSFISWHFIEKRFLFKSSHYLRSESKL